MKHGLAISAAGACGDPYTLAQLAHLAERAGWDGVFLEDYIIHWSGAATYDPWIVLAAIALQTEHIRLGTTVTPLARRRPWKVARETVTLDHLSKGRLILGIGLGNGDQEDFTHFGEEQDDRTRARLLDEGLAILAGLWSGRPFSYAGEHFRLNAVTFLPKSVQTPRIPIWIGGAFPRKGPLARAARWDGAVLYKQTNGAEWLDMTPDDVHTLKTLVDSQRAATIPPNTRMPFDIAIGGRPRRDDWRQERAYVRALAQAGATWWLEEISAGTLDEMQRQIERGPLPLD